jgi:uncharacterized protein (DUF305 family)
MSCKILAQEKITDREFLELMIKHHNVAIKMSEMILLVTQDDWIHDYARKTIYNQSYEIHLMEKLLKDIPNIQNKKSCNCGNRILTNKIEELYPNIFTNLKCQDYHFEKFTNTSLQLKDTQNFVFLESFAQTEESKEQPKMTDEEYVNHMKEHHKSGVELAKLVLKSTNEPKILTFAQNVVLDQEKEMFVLNNLYKCVKYNWRKNK